MKKEQYIDWLEDTLYQAGFLTEEDIEQAILQLEIIIKDETIKKLKELIK